MEAIYLPCLPPLQNVQSSCTTKSFNRSPSNLARGVSGANRETLPWGVGEAQGLVMSRSESLNLRDVAESLIKAFAAFFGFAYICGYLIASSHLEELGIRSGSVNMIRAKYVWLGFLYLLPLLTIAAGASFHRLNPTKFFENMSDLRLWHVGINSPHVVAFNAASVLGSMDIDVAEQFCARLTAGQIISHPVRFPN